MEDVGGRFLSGGGGGAGPIVPIPLPPAMPVFMGFGKA